MGELDLERLPFCWVGGELSLDFNNTVAWSSAGLLEERLRSYDDLLDWAVEAGVLRDARRLRADAAAAPSAGSRALRRALDLRNELHHVFSAIARHQRMLGGGRYRVASGHVVRLNTAASDALRHLQLEKGDAGFTWNWKLRGGTSDLNLPSWAVAWSAAQVLTSNEVSSIRTCANDECGWIFVDRSRRHNRRWCEMEVCGSRDKARRYYRRRRTRQR